MKTRKNIYFKVVALAVIAIAFAMPAKAQLSDNGYANIDWQFNAPLSNHFAANGIVAEPFNPTSGVNLVRYMLKFALT